MNKRKLTKTYWLDWVVIFQTLVGYDDILIFGKSPIKWRQRPDMTIAVDWDVKHPFKQTNKVRFNKLGIAYTSWNSYATSMLNFCNKNIHLRNEFHFSGVHGAMNRSGSRAK